ncbi:Cj0814 family flagellar-dependent secreted protein [Helicobacter apodemus]|uniref:Uncharacterized protein n=1 Tax=Helicobacter apodemus TaxID=135569 RepID=A0A2U8FE12_9HELI|nr:hypothetical protein [Helicobacter apodemus]AWI34394.1 hypothetical protein CDV25_06195 [Helicobacter apodemus]
MIGSLNSSFSLSSFSLNISNNLRISNTNASNTNNADNTNIEKNNQSIESKKSSLDSKEILGYKVDKEGYFTKEFNKAAGIPEDYKIHSSSLESLVRVYTNPNRDISSITFMSIDIAKTIGNAYKILSQVVGEDTLKDKDSFSLEEIAKFPQGYEYDRRSLQVTRVHQTTKDYMNFVNNEANLKDLSKQDKHISTLFFSSSETMRQGLPATDIFNNYNGGKESKKVGVWFNPNGSKYINEDNSITKGGLLVAIANSDIYMTEGETTVLGKIQGFDKNLSKGEMKSLEPMYFFNGTVTNPILNDKDYFDLMTETDVNKIKEKYAKLFQSNKVVLESKKEKNYKSPMQIMLEELDEAMKKNLKRIQKKKQEEKQRIQQAMKKLDINA